jgi:hypothetical protein
MPGLLHVRCRPFGTLVRGVPDRWAFGGRSQGAHPTIAPVQAISARYRRKLLLMHRPNLNRMFLDFENAIRRSLKAFGIKIAEHGVGRLRSGHQRGRGGRSADRRPHGCHAERPCGPWFSGASSAPLPSAKTDNGSSKIPRPAGACPVRTRKASGSGRKCRISRSWMMICGRQRGRSFSRSQLCF